MIPLLSGVQRLNSRMQSRTIIAKGWAEGRRRCLMNIVLDLQTEKNLDQCHENADAADSMLEGGNQRVRQQASICISLLLKSK